MRSISKTNKRLVVAGASKAEIRDAVEVLKDFTFYGDRRFLRLFEPSVDIDDAKAYIRQQAVQNAPVTIPIKDILTHHDWGRRIKPSRVERPIIVVKAPKRYRKKYVVLDGQHRVFTLRDQGETLIEAYVIDFQPKRVRKSTTKTANPYWWDKPINSEEYFYVDPSIKVSVQDLLEVFDEIIDIQCTDGNWNFNPYMHGMANGLIFMRSLVGAGRPEYLEAPDEWLEDSSEYHELQKVSEKPRRMGRNLYYPARARDETLRAVPDLTRYEATRLNRLKPVKRTPETPGTVVDTIVETCGRNYHPEECEDYMDGFLFAAAELEPFVEAAMEDAYIHIDDWRDAEWEVVDSSWQELKDETYQHRPVSYFEGESTIRIIIGGIPYIVYFQWNYYPREALRKESIDIVYLEVEEDDLLIRNGPEDGEPLTFKTLVEQELLSKIAEYELNVFPQAETY